MIKVNLLEEKKNFSLSFISNSNEYIKALNWKFLVVAILLSFVPDLVATHYLDGKLEKYDVEKEELQKKNKKIKKYNNQHKNLREELKDFEKHREELKKRIQQIENIIKKKTNPALSLEAIARQIPKEIWLVELSISKEAEIVIKGLSRSHSSISTFYSDLNKTLFFQGSLKLKNIKTINEQEFGRKVRYESFTIEGKIVRFDTWGS